MVVFSERCPGLCPLLIESLVSSSSVQLGSSGRCALHVHPVVAESTCLFWGTRSGSQGQGGTHKGWAPPPPRLLQHGFLVSPSFLCGGRAEAACCARECAAVLHAAWVASCPSCTERPHARACVLLGVRGSSPAGARAGGVAAGVGAGPCRLRASPAERVAGVLSSASLMAAVGGRCW